jgi:hypothetical protein
MEDERERKAEHGVPEADPNLLTTNQSTRLS